MRIKALLLALLAAGLAVSVAVAAPPPGKGNKHPKSGEGCKPEVSLVLRGIVTSDPEGVDAAFTMSVTGANRHGQNWVTNPATMATIKVNADSKIKRRGPQTSLAPIEQNDRALAVYRVCKADLPIDPGELAALVAKRVRAHPAPAS